LTCIFNSLNKNLSALTSWSQYLAFGIGNCSSLLGSSSLNNGHRRRFARPFIASFVGREGLSHPQQWWPGTAFSLWISLVLCDLLLLVLLNLQVFLVIKMDTMFKLDCEPCWRTSLWSISRAFMIKKILNFCLPS
jgi:hypothetical protein